MNIVCHFLHKLLPPIKSFLSFFYSLSFSPIVASMELNDANLQTLTEFLRKTLDPDPTVRRPGKSPHLCIIMMYTEQLFPLTCMCKFCHFCVKALRCSTFLFPPLSAEKFLESVEGNQNYPLLLLTLLEKSQDNVSRVCAAVTFKNYIKRNWRIVSPTSSH